MTDKNRLNGADIDISTVKKGDRFRVTSGNPHAVGSSSCEKRCCAAVIVQTVEVIRVGRKRHTLAVRNDRNGCTLLLKSRNHELERVADDEPLSCVSSSAIDALTEAAS